MHRLMSVFGINVGMRVIALRLCVVYGRGRQDMYAWVGRCLYISFGVDTACGVGGVGRDCERALTWLNISCNRLMTGTSVSPRVSPAEASLFIIPILVRDLLCLYWVLNVQFCAIIAHIGTRALVSALWHLPEAAK